MDVNATPADVARVFALDEGLRGEADRMLAASGLGEVLRAEGYNPVGSYVMRTMTWRDLDFELLSTRPSWPGASGGSRTSSPGGGRGPDGTCSQDVGRKSVGWSGFGLVLVSTNGTNKKE